MAGSDLSTEDDFDKGFAAFLTLYDPGYWVEQCCEVGSVIANEYLRSAALLASVTGMVRLS